MNPEPFPQTEPFSEGENNSSSSQAWTEHYAPGDLIGGRLEIHESISGGMARVYLCYDREQDAFFALKTFRFREQVWREPRARSQLDDEVRKWIALGEHDHIVRCFRLEIIDNLPFIMMEWVADTDRLCELYQRHHQGEAHFLDWYARLGVRGLPLRRLSATRNRERKGSSLAGWIKPNNGLDDLQLALQITQEICNGLAHALNGPYALVHRDLKPSNILLNEQRRAKITDFGIAAETRNLLVQAETLGTYEYMAPEQWLGGEPDSRSDVYALGCILYEMLTGNFVFKQRLPDRKAEDFREQHLYATPPSLRGRYTTPLDAIVRSCLQKDPAARLASCIELGDEIAVLYRHLFVKAPAAAAPKRSPTLEDLNQEAFTYFGLGNYQLALDRLTQAIALDSSHPNAYNNRGCVHHQLGNYPEATKDYADAVRLGRSEINAKPRNNRGLVFLMLQQPDRARGDFNRAIEDETDYANAYVNRGLTYAELGGHAEAEKDYSKAIALNRTHVLAYHNRGYLYQQLGRLQEAESDYSAAIMHDPAFAQARINRYLLRRHLGQAALAEEDREVLARLIPSVAPQPWQAAPQISKPDPLFVNTNSFDDLIQNSFRQHRLAKRINEETWGGRSTPSDRMPLRSLVSVKEVGYSDELHATIRRRLAQGERLTQVTAQIKLMRSYSGSIADKLPTIDSCEILIDQEAMRMMAAEDMLTLADMRHHMLVLDNENPDDPHYPLRIWNVL